MSIFDGLDPGQIADMLNGQFGQDTATSVMGAQQSQGAQAPIMPEMSGGGGGERDMSAFANYGMTPPSLPDPISQMGGLMGMMGDPHQNRKEDPFMQQQQGGLMAYLQQLGVV